MGGGRGLEREGSLEEQSAREREGRGEAWSELGEHESCRGGKASREDPQGAGTGQRALGVL